MIKVSILKNGIVTNQAQFPSQPEADAWLAKEIANESFGKDAWTETIPAVYDVDGITAITPEQTINHPAEFSFTQEDITAQIETEKKIQKNLARMDFGKRIMAELAQRNQDRLLAGETTINDILSAEAKLAVIQRYLLNGSLGIAFQGLQTADIPELPAPEKAYFLTKIQDYLASEV